MKIDLPGLLKERLPSGGYRYRVRVEGNKARRVRLNVGPDHPEFMEHYRAARVGISLTPETPPDERALRGSIDWLVAKHLADLGKKVKAGQFSPLTLKKRRHLMKRFCDLYGPYSLNMPTAKIIELRDDMVATPAAADSMVEAIRSLYRWACDVGICDVNPAIGVRKIDRGNGGAVPWTADDLRQFRQHHVAGTKPHLALTIFMFTACRVSDAIRLGRKNEFTRDGVMGLSWQPAKRGSAKVEIPMMPPLYKATRAAAVVGDTYLLNRKGQPFSTPDSLGQMFRRWCVEAGLKNRSSHGIRKATGSFLAQEGCTQYQIMSIHGHTEPKTSAIYTQGAERWTLSKDAMQRFKTLEW